MDAAEIAEILTEHFGVEHTAQDITGSREVDGATVATTAFGNKVRISGDAVEVLTGPAKPATGPVEAPPAAEPVSQEPQGDLPPLQGVAEDDATDESGEDVDLDSLTKKQLVALAADRGVEVPPRANKAALLAALQAAAE